MRANGSNLQTPEISVGQEFEAYSWQPIVDEAERKRTLANRLSDLRGEWSGLLGTFVLATADKGYVPRSVAGLALGGLWETDRRDGKNGKGSLKMLEQLCQTEPSAAEDPRVQHLLSDEVRADGARRDAGTDKEMANTVTRSLFNRTVVEKDPLGAFATSLTMLSTEIRDEKMANIRNRGEEAGVDVKARFWGKVKTGLLAGGQVAATVAKPRSKLSRAGYGAMLASNVAGWLGVAQMNRHVNQAIAGTSIDPES